MKAAVILNLSAGKENDSEFSYENIIKALNETNLTYDIFNIKKQDVSGFSMDEIRNNYDMLVAAGGDGTVSYTASIAVKSGLPMGIIPAGTLNHFAKDNNIPLNLKESVAVISGGNINQLDAASANDRIFINNSSLGLYALAVRQRDSGQSKHGFSKWLAMFAAFISVFKRFPLYNIRLKADGDSENLISPIIFIGNNEYKLDITSLGERESIKKGVLSLYVAKCRSRLGILGLIASALFNRLTVSDDFETRLVKEAVIESGKKRLYAAFDGEVVYMETPITYKILPKKLKVIVPQP